MATPDVRVRLSAEGVQEVLAAFKKVQSGASSIGKGASGSVDGLGRSFGKLTEILQTLGVVLSVGALISFARRSAELGEQLNKTTQKLGGAARETVGLALAARLADVDVGQLGPTIGVVSKNLTDFESGGGKASKALKALGFEAGDFKGKSLTEAFVSISQRLGPLEAGFKKNALIVDIFGKKAISLIPLLNSLSTEGIDRFIERSAKLFTADALAGAEAFNDALKRIDFELQGLGVQFISGFAPAMIQELNLVEDGLDDAAEGYRKLGEVAGTVAKLLAAPFISVAAVIAAFVALVVVSVRGLVDTLNLVANADYSGAARRLGLLAKQVGSVFRNEAKTIADSWRIVGEAPKGVSARTPLGRPAPDVDGETSRRRASAIRAALENELRLSELHARRLSDVEKRAFEDGVISLRQSFERRREILETAAQSDLQLLEARLAGAPAGSDERDAVEQRIKKRQEELAGDAAQLAAEELGEARKLGQERLRSDQQLLEAQGQRHQAAMIQIDQEVAERQKLLIRQGAAPEAAAFNADQLRQVLEAREQFRRLQESADLKLSELARERDRVQGEVARGIVGEAEGEGQILALEQKRLPVLQGIASEMTTIAGALKDPALVQQAAELNDKLIGVGESQNKLNVELKNLGQNVAQAGLDAFADSLARIGEERGVLSFLAAFLDSLKRIAAQILAMQIFKGLGLGSLLGLGGGGAVPGKARGGTVQRRASGGIISGPGSGTSDSILTVAPPGAYIVRAAAVRRPGILERLRTMVGGRPARRRREEAVPVRVSDGEFYVAPEVAAAPGARAELEAINRGAVRPPASAIEAMREDIRSSARFRDQFEKLERVERLTSKDLAIRVGSPATAPTVTAAATGPRTVQLATVREPGLLTRLWSFVTGRSAAPAPERLERVSFSKRERYQFHLAGPLSAQRRASGGVIRGPGSSTSDSITTFVPAGSYIVRAAAVAKPRVLQHLRGLVAGRPSAARGRAGLVLVRVSDREFYVPPEVARAPGMHRHLEAINRGVFSPILARADLAAVQRGMQPVHVASLEQLAPTSSFAEGGMVSGAAGRAGADGARGKTTLDGTLTILLPPGAEAELDAPESVRKLIRVVSKNPRAFRRALGD